MSHPLDKKPFIIADVGSNWKRYSNWEHNLALAYRHIDDAKLCDCDAVKFQLYTHRELYGVDGPDEYALPYGWIPKLASYANIRGIEFMCTAFSPEGARLVDPYVRIHKVASSEFSYWDLLNALFETEKPIIYSAGAATPSDINKLMDGIITEKDVLLECVAAYPAEPQYYNLAAMRSWNDRYQVGISDHTTSDILAVTSVGMGATVFEKHFDALQIDLPHTDTPDASFSVGPVKLSQYVAQIRDAFSLVSHHKPEGILDCEMGMHTRYKRRLKITKHVKGGQDILQNGVNFGSFRSLEDDTRAAWPSDLGKFEGKRVKKDMNPQDGLWYDDLESSDAR